MVKVAYTVGRFQPPTIGHKALIQRVIDEAKNAASGPSAAGAGPVSEEWKAYVFVSSVQTERSDNPLDIEDKLPILQHMFPCGNVEFVNTKTCDPKCGGPFAAFKYILAKHQGITPNDITLVIGSDREPDFGKDSPKWEQNGIKEPPGRITPIPRQAKNESLEDLTAGNMSGTKARTLVDKRDENAAFKASFYKALGYDLDAVESAYAKIRDRPIKSKKGGGETEDEDMTAFNDNEDGNPPQSAGRRRRRTRRNKASSKALYRRGSRSRTGSSKNNRSSYGPRGY
jgi:nicotinic acid mononucleotide adenylyltransferase